MSSTAVLKDLVAARIVNYLGKGSNVGDSLTRDLLAMLDAHYAAYETRPAAPVVLTVDGLLTEQDAERITERIGKHLKGALRLPDPRCWVLVKGYHDSGTVNGVYGPYTEAHIDWLLTGLLEFTTDNWTKVKLSSGPEET